MAVLLHGDAVLDSQIKEPLRWMSGMRWFPGCGPPLDVDGRASRGDEDPDILATEQGPRDQFCRTYRA